MSNLAVIKPGQSLIEFDNEKVELIRKTFGKELSQGEFELFLATAKARGLDPLMNQVHAVKRKDGDEKKMVIQVGIDGYRLVAARTGSYAGKDETRFDYTGDKKIPNKATVTVYKIVQGQRVGFTESAMWSEYYPGERMGFMWRKMPETMLSKCAEAKALRSAFPADLAGLYVPEEFEQDRSTNAPTEKVVEARKRFEEPPPQEKAQAALPDVDQGERFIAVKIDFKDVESRNRLKAMGFQWDKEAKYWEHPEVDDIATTLTEMGFEFEVVSK